MKNNFQIIEKELNELNGKLEAANMLNTFVIGIIASMSDPFKTELKSALEQVLESGLPTPGDFKKRASDLLRHVLECPSTGSTQIAPFLRLIQSGSQPESRNPQDKGCPG